MTSIGDAVIATDSEGRISFLNPAAAALTGWTEQEALGRPVRDVFHIIDDTTRRPGEDVVARALSEGKTVTLNGATSLIVRNGREISVEDSTAPIKDRDGRLLGAVVVFQDSTEKRRRQEALESSRTAWRPIWTDGAAARNQHAPGRLRRPVLAPEGDRRGVDRHHRRRHGSIQLIDEAGG